MTEMGKDFNKDSNSGSRVGTVQPGIRVAIIHLGLILLAYGLVRLSCLMSISGSPTLWAANGLHIASILSARPKQRAVIPIGFLIIAFVGLLSIHDFSIAGLLSAIHTAESLIIAGAMHALSKNYGLDSYEVVCVLFASSSCASLVAAVCRSFVMQAMKGAGAISLADLILLDWFSCLFGVITLAPFCLEAFRMPKVVLKETALFGASLVMASLLAFGVQCLSIYSANSLVIFLQSPALFAAGWLFGYHGLALAGLMIAVSNIGFTFYVHQNTTEEHLIQIVISTLYAQTAVSAFALVITFLLRQQGASNSNSISLTKSKDKLRNSIERKPVANGSVNSISLLESDDSMRELEYLRLVYKKIHNPLINIMEACQSARQKADGDVTKFMFQVEQNTTSALSQIEDIMIIKRLEAGVIKPESTNICVSDLINPPVSRAQKSLNRNKILFEQRSNTFNDWVVIDVGLFQQALSNVLLGPLDHLAIYPERVVLHVKYDNVSTDSDLAKLDISVTMYNSSAKKTEDIDTLFTEYPIRTDALGNMFCSAMTFAIGKRLIEVLGSKLKVKTIDGHTWMASFELICQKSQGPVLNNMSYELGMKDMKSKSETNQDMGLGGIGNILLKSEVLSIKMETSRSFERATPKSIGSQEDALSQRSVASFDSRLSIMRRENNQKKKQVHYQGDTSPDMGFNDFDITVQPTVAALPSTESSLGRNYKALKNENFNEVVEIESPAVGRQRSVRSISIRVPSLKSARSSTAPSRDTTILRDVENHNSHCVIFNVEDTDETEMELVNSRQNSSLPGSRRSSTLPPHRQSASGIIRRPSFGPAAPGTQSLNRNNSMTAKVTEAGNSSSPEIPRTVREVTEPLFPPSIPEVMSRTPSLTLMESSPNSKSEDDSNWTSGRILIGDSSSVFRQIAKGFLSSISKDYVIVEASDGQEVINLAQEFNFNVLFLDCDMSAMKGNDAVYKIRTLGIQAPIILISSGILSHEDSKRIIALGISDIVSKPISKDILVVLLRKHMGRSVSRKHSLKRDESNRSSKTASADLPVSTVIRQTHSDCQPASGEEEKKLATIKSFGSQDVVKVMQQPPNPIRSSDEAPNNTAYLSKKRSANILVVDDSGVNRAILSKLLKNNEYVSDIVELSTGHDAVRFCSKRIFTLIFMDLEMPGMNGEEAAARIRAMGVQTPIIAVTGNIVRGNDESLLKSVGIDRIVMKPVSRSAVNEICKHFLGQENEGETKSISNQAMNKQTIGAVNFALFRKSDVNK